MIIITLMALVLLFHNYSRLAYLLNPGFVSLYDQYLERNPFVNSPYLKSILEDYNIRDGLFGEVTTQVQGEYNVKNLSFAPFWVDMDRWLMAIFLIAMILLVVNRILVAKKKLPEYIADISVYVMVILSVGGYYLAAKVLGNYTPKKADFHGTILSLVIFSIFAIVFGIIRKTSVDRRINDFEEYKKKYILHKPGEKKTATDYSSDDLEDYLIKNEAEKKEEEEEKPKKKMTFAEVVVMVQVLLFLILPCKFMIDAMKVSHDYKPNYGSFDPKKLTVRYDLEKSGFAGNFANQAVETDDGLFFIERDVKDIDDETSAVGYRRIEKYYIRKLDKDGNITDICPTEGDNKKRKFSYVNIGYADGYIYASTSYYISRIDPKDGSEVEVVSAPSHYFIGEMCVVDNKLYYLEHPEDNKTEDMSRIWVADIDGTSLSEPELFVTDIDRDRYGSFNYWYSSSLFTTFILGEKADFYSSDYSRYQKYNGKEYYMTVGDVWTDGDYKTTGLASCDRSVEGSYNSIGMVGGFNLYNDSIYYVQLKHNGFDVCKCNMDGADVKVLGTYNCTEDLTYNNNQANYRVMIGQGKIYVSAVGYIYPDEDYKYEYDMEPGTIHFVTDLE